MQHRLRPLLACLAVALLLAACSTPPVAPPPPAPAAPVAPVAPPPPPEPELPPGVTISPPRQGDASVAFVQSRVGERTFPNNRIGANLAFTSNLRMPRLEAVAHAAGGYQLRMRFSNATATPLAVSLVCTYDGEKKPARVIRELRLPVNSFRDISIDLEGDPARKLDIRAVGSARP